MINSKNIILYLVGLVLPLCSMAQARLSIHGDISQILIHTSKIHFDVDGPSYGLGLSYAAAPCPENESYQRRGLPWLGANLYFMDYGTPEVGKVYSFYPSIHARHHISDRVHLESMIGFGIGFASRYYDRQPWSDTLYNALGSHINNTTVLSESCFIELRSGDEMSVSVMFAHVSSAAASAPNFGINNIGLGLNYHFMYPDHRPYGTPRKAHAARHRNAIDIGYTFTMDRALLGYEIPVYSISYKHHWVDTTRLASWFVGAEAVLNTKEKGMLQYTNIHGEPLRNTDFMSYYLSGGREWYMGDFGVSVCAQLGFDVYGQKMTHLEKFLLYYYPFNIDYRTQNILRNSYLGIGLCTKFVNAQYPVVTLGTFF